MAENAQDTTFTFNGETIGGVDSWELQTGVAQESVFRQLDGPPRALPGVPDFGQVILNLYRDTADYGQIEMLSSLKNRAFRQMVIRHPDGTTYTFNAFTLLYPIRGSRSGSTPISTIRCVMRIDGNMV
jgi:hypothetical protein